MKLEFQNLPYAETLIHHYLSLVKSNLGRRDLCSFLDRYVHMHVYVVIRNFYMYIKITVNQHLPLL